MKVIRSGFGSIKESLSDEFFQMRKMFEVENKGALAWSRYWEYPFALLEAKTSLKILDVGAGKSVFKSVLLNLGYDVTTLDPDTKSFEKAIPERLTQVAGSVLDIPFEEASFDGVFCLSVLEHLKPDEPMLAMREMERVLKPGGHLVVTFDVNLDPSKPYHFTIDEYRKFVANFLPKVPPVAVTSDTLTSSLYYWEMWQNLIVFGMDLQK